MANLSYDEYLNSIQPFLKNFEIELDTHPKKDLLIESMRSSANTLKRVAENLVCYFQDVKSYNQKAIEKFIGSSSQILIELRDKINNIETWNEASLDKMLKEYREEKNLSVPSVNQPIRIALTGSTNSPSLGMTLYLFEKNEVIKRINALIDFLHKEN